MTYKFAILCVPNSLLQQGLAVETETLGFKPRERDEVPNYLNVVPIRERYLVLSLISSLRVFYHAIYSPSTLASVGHQ